MLKLFNSPESFLQVQSTKMDTDEAVAEQVRKIIVKVQSEGDAALRFYTHKFDGVAVQNFRTPQEKITAAGNSLPDELRQIFSEAVDNVHAFHQKQLPVSWNDKSEDGTELGLRFTPIASVGIYVPGGTAAYPSTVIMTAVPAQIAAVPQIALVSPPDRNGCVNPLVLAVANLLGIRDVFAVGGAQAIAALTYGTDTIPKVDKIIGPGNAFVNEAKRQVFGLVGIDALAGPTELVILADESAPPEWVVRDLCAQAEHDVAARVILISTSRLLIQEVNNILQAYISKVKRNDILQQSLRDHGAAIVLKEIQEAYELINKIAPEHLEIMTKNPEHNFSHIQNAGAIFLGKYSPAVVGDYFAGSNHVLPTGRNARFESPLSVWDFMKFSSIVKYSKSRFKKDVRKIARFAELENLFNHQAAMECRNE